LVIGDLGHAKSYLNSKLLVTRGSMVGTFGYMAPEIIKGETDFNIIEKASKIDIWYKFLSFFIH
jgi:serine/threonine protein kinase